MIVCVCVCLAVRLLYGVYSLCVCTCVRARRVDLRVINLM